MPINDALSFIKRMDEEEFRKNIYAGAGSEKFKEFLTAENLKFTIEELEEAHNLLMFKAIEESDADSLRNKISLLKLLGFKLSF
jgi:hypothetical protein